MDKIAYKEELKRAENAEVVLWYASDNNIKVDESIVDSILNFKAFLLKSDKTIDLEEYAILKKSFIKSCTELNTLKNINSKGILAIEKTRHLITLRKYKFFRFSLSDRLMIAYKFGMVSVMIVTLLGHFYWFNGLSYLQKYNEIENSIQLLSNSLELVDSNSESYPKFVEKITHKQIDKTNIITALCKWSVVLSFKSNWQERTNFANIDYADCHKGFCIVPENQKKIIRTVIINLRLLDNYLLPLLYGLLGAIIYSLRSLSFEIKNYTFNKFSKINYATRLFLGAFAGIAIGWFINSGENDIDANKIYSLSPIIMAFVAGYNIEFLFLLIDRYIKGVKKPSDENEKE